MTKPKLAPPGAGLPKPELLIARMRFGLKRWRISDKGAIDEFASCHAAILNTCRDYNDDQASKQILIRRLRGLEDSSRNWSIFMTLEHLRIVNDLIRDICRTLAVGQTPPGVASTADVKPSSDTGPEVVQAFDDSCTGFVEVVSAIDNLSTEAKYEHPWFGPMDASGWLVLAAFHMRLHHGQIHRIGKGIKSSAAA